MLHLDTFSRNSEVHVVYLIVIDCDKTALWCHSCQSIHFLEMTRNKHIKLEGNLTLSPASRSEF